MAKAKRQKKKLYFIRVHPKEGSFHNQVVGKAVFIRAHSAEEANKLAKEKYPDSKYQKRSFARLYNDPNK